MSNFPILPTTPPPLDLNENDEEEDQEFGSFDAVSPEEDGDIEFVVPDLEQLSDQNGDDKLEKNCLDDKEKSEQDKDNSEEIDDFPYDNEFKCDFEANRISEVINEIISEDNKNNSNLNENSIESKPSSDEDDSSHDKRDFKAEEKQFSGNLEASEMINNEDDFDFGDFASFNLNNVKQSQDNFNENRRNSDEKQSLSFYKSDLPFNDNKTDNFTTKRNSQSNELKDKENDDEFADFASAQPVLNSDVQPISDSQLLSSEPKESEDEFADFSSFQDSNENNFVEYPDVVSNANPSQYSDKLSQLFADAFPIQEPVGSVENAENISKDLFSGADTNSKNLWKNLKDLENASSLKVKWTASHCFQLLLAALNIDPRNILRNSSVPMFASGLGFVLEPTKHQTNGEFSHDMGPESETTPTTTSIPPVQFDWSSSGLTNPLDLNQKSMPAFDLDFFVTNDDLKNTNRQIDALNFEDLLSIKGEEGLAKESLVSEPKNHIMQQILSTANSTSIPKSGGNQVLSAEALQVLQELPNLSFMRAKVLMFPLINIKNS